MVALGHQEAKAIASIAAMPAAVFTTWINEPVESNEQNGAPIYDLKVEQ